MKPMKLKFSGVVSTHKEHFDALLIARVTSLTGRNVERSGTYLHLRSFDEKFLNNGCRGKPKHSFIKDLANKRVRITVTIEDDGKKAKPNK